MLIGMGSRHRNMSRDKCPAEGRRPEANQESVRSPAGPYREEEQEEPEVEDEEGGNAAADKGGEAHGSFREVGDAQAALPGRLVADQQRVRHVHEAVQVILLCTRTISKVRHPECIPPMQQQEDSMCRLRIRARRELVIRENHARNVHLACRIMLNGRENPYHLCSVFRGATHIQENGIWV